MGHLQDPTAFRYFFIVGLALLPLGIVTHPAFLGAGSALFVIGLVGLARHRAQRQGPGS